VTDAAIGRVQVLWDKLRRRKVVQWGIAYCLFAWGLLQGLAYLSSTFGWPQLLQQLATLASLIGLPIVLVVAWYHGDRGEQQISATEFLILFGLLLLGAHCSGGSAPPACPRRTEAKVRTRSRPRRTARSACCPSTTSAATLPTGSWATASPRNSRTG
jgi:hypothetical protein